MIDENKEENNKPHSKKNKGFIEKVFIAPFFLDKYCIYDDYSELLDGVFYYQDQQIEIKISVIKILIATIAMSGALSFYNIGLSNYLLTLTSSVLPLISLSIISICLFHDLVYKEELKIGFFSEASKYEKKYSWIPSYHKCLVTETKVHSIRGTTQIFLYFGCAGVLLLISSLTLFVHFSTLIPKIIIFCLFSIFFVLYILGINKALKHPLESLKKLENAEECKENKPELTQVAKDFFSAKLLGKGKQYIEHFSTIKKKYKKLTITVIGALLLALSYVAGYANVSTHITKLHFISFLIVVSVIGLNLIRYLDVNVSHAQIRMLFKTVLMLEEKEKSLPQPYTKISQLLYSKKFDPVLIDYLY